MTTQPRMNYYAAAPALYSAFARVSEDLKKSGFDPILRSLVELRASQINGCIFCIDMHTKEARIAGERELRLHHLAAWRESPLFSSRERAALAWTEALTRLGGHGAGGAVEQGFESLRGHFSEGEIAQLTLLVATINAWNRIGVGFGSVPGSLDTMYGLDKAGLH